MAGPTVGARRGAQKSSLCRNFTGALGSCRFGATCDFAHSQDELQLGRAMHQQVMQLVRGSVRLRLLCRGGH